MTELPNSVRQWLVQNGYCVESDDDKQFNQGAAEAIKEGHIQALIDAGLQTDPTSTRAFGGKGAGAPRVKAASEMYPDVRYKGNHARTGKPVKGFSGEEVETSSKRDYAKMGAFIKFKMVKDRVPGVVLTEHEQALVNEMFDTKEKWVGTLNGTFQEFDGARAKTLLNDAGSGGEYVNPLWFDLRVTSEQLLSGELAPFVDLQEVPRGVTIDSAKIGIPTVTWGANTDGTSQTEFDTTGLVTPLDSSVTNVFCYLEVSRNLLADTVVNLGEQLGIQIGKRMGAELDKICAIGDGSTQPQGLSNTSGMTNVISTLSEWTLGELENLAFSVPKQYRKSNLGMCFVCNDATYRRIRQLPVGPQDGRRLLGMDEMSYTALDIPCRIEVDIPDATIFAGPLKYYRLYRRQGQEMRWYQEGQTLALKNTVLLAMYGRYAGRVMLPEAWSSMTNAPVN